MSRGLSPTLLFVWRYTQMAENNAICSICGSGYYVCLSCKDKMRLHPYKIYCCSPSHFQVFQVVRGFSTGVYDKDEFKSKLKNIDLSDLENYRDHIKTLIKDVLKEEKVEVVVEAAKKIEKIVVEEAEIGEITEDIVKPTVSRKRSYKVETA